LLSVVPKKFVPGLVPLLPVTAQFCASEDIISTQEKNARKKICFFINS